MGSWLLPGDASGGQLFVSRGDVVGGHHEPLEGAAGMESFKGAPRCGTKSPVGEEALRAAYTPDNIYVVWYDPTHGVRQINVNEVGL
jgi:hypothetical protein